MDNRPERHRYWTDLIPRYEDDISWQDDKIHCPVIELTFAGGNKRLGIVNGYEKTQGRIVLRGINLEITTVAQEESISGTYLTIERLIEGYINDVPDQKHIINITFKGSFRDNDFRDRKWSFWD